MTRGTQKAACNFMNKGSRAKLGVDGQINKLLRAENVYFFFFLVKSAKLKLFVKEK